MVRLPCADKNKRLLAWSIIAACLFLVSLGIRVPNLTLLHASPKPTPRAVIETASNAGKPALAKQVIAIELFHSAPELLAATLFPSRFLPVAYRFNFTLTPQISARAPPVSAS
jgi:hypothetical protein